MTLDLTLSTLATTYLAAAQPADSVSQYNAKAQALNSLFSFLSNHLKLPPTRTTFDDLTLEHITSYQIHLQKTRSPETEHLYTRSIVHFIQSFANQHASLQNPEIQSLITHLQINKRQRPHIVQPIPIEAISIILDNAHVLDVSPDAEQNDRTYLQALRDRAIIYLLADTGIRPAELIALRTADLHEATIQVNNARIFTAAQTLAYITQYLTARQRAKLKALASEPLFSRHDKRASNHLLPISRWTLANIISTMASRHLPSDLQRQLATRAISLSPISFRHHFVITTLMATNNVVATSLRARHKDLATTRQYLPQSFPVNPKE